MVVSSFFFFFAQRSRKQPAGYTPVQQAQVIMQNPFDVILVVESNYLKATDTQSIWGFCAGNPAFIVRS